MFYLLFVFLLVLFSVSFFGDGGGRVLHKIIDFAILLQSPYTGIRLILFRFFFYLAFRSFFCCFFSFVCFGCFCFMATRYAPGSNALTHILLWC